MQFLHLTKICHRDIKSHNILLDENYKVKLCDFGHARRIGDLNFLGETHIQSHFPLNG